MSREALTEKKQDLSQVRRGAGVMCTHYACRCARSAELADMADGAGDSRLLVEGIGVHSQEVNCRQQVVPRDDSSGGRDIEEMRQ